MVLRTEGCAFGIAEDRWRDEASAGWFGYFEVEKLGVLYQPVQSFLAGLEGRQFSLRKSLHVLVEYLGQAFHSHPSRTLQMRPVEHQRRLKTLNALLVEVRASEIGQKQHRFQRFSGDPGGNKRGEFFQLLSRAAGTIHEKDFLLLMADETDAILHSASSCRGKRHSRARTVVSRLRTGN